MRGSLDPAKGSLLRYSRSLVWIRRDIRLDDHAALFDAIRSSEEVAIAFVLETSALKSSFGSPIVTFFFSALKGLRGMLQGMGSDLVILEGDPPQELLTLAARLNCEALFFNMDTDPRAKARDEEVSRVFLKAGKGVHTSNDVTVFTSTEIRQHNGSPYTVFTPYKKRWLTQYTQDPRPPFPSARELRKRLLPIKELGPSKVVPTPEAFGYTSNSSYPLGDERSALKQLQSFCTQAIESYDTTRNFFALHGTSYLSPHLRAGTIGIRRCVAEALAASHTHRGTKRTSCDIWLSELIWREFYHHILEHHPRIVTEPFESRAASIAFLDDEKSFDAWWKGQTGYPVVDAAMRQLNTTGWMHNRLRMISASFLTKDLLIDYRHGERYFEQTLADADLAANNGGWQWTASTGTDAAPYFRVFNPVTQSRTFDPEGTFLRRMLPELAALPNKYLHAPWTAPPLILREAGVTLGETYPLPLVEHNAARLRALDAYAKALKKQV